MQLKNQQARGYKTILLRAVEEASFGRTLAAATDLGRAFGSHIIGFATLPGAAPVPAGESGKPGVPRWDADRRAAEAEHARMAPYFLRSCAAGSLTADWVVADRDDQRGWATAERMTRAVDLIVAPPPQVALGKASPDHDAEDLLLSAGRPVLLLPRGVELRACPERVLIAWNGSREAARAVFDALPLLEAARTVTVTSIIGQRNQTANLSARSLARGLERQGVHALVNEIDVGVPEVGTALLSAAKADGSELMVMGGYGHSRYTEWVLGSTTRHVLRHTHLPVLMSH